MRLSTEILFNIKITLKLCGTSMIVSASNAWPEKRYVYAT